MKTRLTILLIGMTIIGAWAELSTVVSPGYTFSPGERMTLEKLNLLGRPVVFVTGTVDGSNALSAGSVFPVHLNAAVAGSNLTYTASGLVVANQGAGANQLATNAFGLGLTGGGGSVLRTVVDTNTITWLGNALTVGAGLSNANLSATAAIAITKLVGVTNTVIGGGPAGTNQTFTLTSPLRFNGSTIEIPSFSYQTATNPGSGLIVNQAHGLSNAPVWVRAYLVCETTDRSYEVGDMITAEAVTSSDATSFVVGANSTNVFVTARSDAWETQAKGDAGSKDNLTKTSWSLKVVAQ